MLIDESKKKAGKKVVGYKWIGVSKTSIEIIFFSFFEEQEKVDRSNDEMESNDDDASSLIMKMYFLSFLKQHKNERWQSSERAARKCSLNWR